MAEFIADLRARYVGQPFEFRVLSEIRELLNASQLYDVGIEILPTGVFYVLYWRNSILLFMDEERLIQDIRYG